MSCRNATAKAATKRQLLPVAVRDTIRCTTCCPAQRINLRLLLDNSEHLVDQGASKGSCLRSHYIEQNAGSGALQLCGYTFCGLATRALYTAATRTATQHALELLLYRLHNTNHSVLHHIFSRCNGSQIERCSQSTYKCRTTPSLQRPAGWTEVL